MAAIFRVARRLAPCVVFLDEIDSLLGRRGAASEHEATRRLRNEFLSQWDGLLSEPPEKERGARADAGGAAGPQRVLVLGATNRPFDLDDAALRRLPRRLALHMPDAAARASILRVLLAEELASARGAGVDVEHVAACARGGARRARSVCRHPGRRRAHSRAPSSLRPVGARARCAQHHRGVQRLRPQAPVHERGAHSDPRAARGRRRGRGVGWRAAACRAAPAAAQQRL